MRISDWSSDVCSSDLRRRRSAHPDQRGRHPPARCGRGWPCLPSYRLPTISRLQITHNVAFCNRIDVNGNRRCDTAALPLSQYCHRGVIQSSSPPPPGKGGVLCVRSPSFPIDSRSEEHTSELQSLLRIPYAVFGLKKKKTIDN